MEMKYPTFDLEEFEKLLDLLLEIVNEPAYLDPAQWPYGTKLREKARNIIEVREVTKSEQTKNPVGRPSKKTALPIDEVEKEIDEIRKEIGQLKLDAKGLETADRIQIIKTRAALVEKIIAMKERVTGLKKMQAFMAVVTGILEDVMEQSQREEVIKRLEPYLDE